MLNLLTFTCNTHSQLLKLTKTISQWKLVCDKVNRICRSFIIINNYIHHRWQSMSMYKNVIISQIK